ncbi:MAG TPA: ABC transporter permease, partial [Candidatus Solibacter sp.]|nr:ABC transporter permease [Candidatus Solibacter sp.]
MRIEHWIYVLPLKARALFRRRRVEQDLDDELQYHIERRTEEYIAQGMTPEQARWAALRAMDGLAHHKEACRDARGVNLFDNAVRDVRYSLRVLAKSPGFTATAIVTLALAIGANAVVFGILNALILRPIDVPRAGSLFEIQRAGWGYESYPDYLDLRDRNRSFEGLAALNIAAAGLSTGATPVRAWLYEVSGNYFDVLGIQPHLGRFFHASDEHGPNSAPYIVLSWAYWHSHFHEDRDVIGRVVRLNKHPFTILGVAPPEFRGTVLFFSPEMFVPIVNHQQVDGRDELNARSRRWVFMTMGHLKPGVTPEQAVADLNSIGAWLEQTYPKDHGKLAFSLGRPGLTADVFRRPALAFLVGLMLLAALILLAACTNLGSLFAARAADRGREVALRLALGASRGRILRTLFTEAVLIALMGGSLGLWASVGVLHGLSAWQPLARFPMHVPVQPDASVYSVALGLALISGLLFGIVPVRQVMRTDPYQVVKAGSGARLGRRVTLRDVMLVAQIAICGVLVTSSLVAVRGLARS